MTIEEGKTDLQLRMEELTSGLNRRDIRAYWPMFKEFCLSPIDHEEQSVSFECLIADFLPYGNAFYIVFKRIIWKLDEDGDLYDVKLSCRVPCFPTESTWGVHVLMGGAPMDPVEYQTILQKIETKFTEICQELKPDIIPRFLN